VDRQEVIAVDVAVVEKVLALGRPEVAFALLRAARHLPERDVEFAQDSTGLVEIELAIGLVDDDIVCAIRPRGKVLFLRRRAAKQSCYAENGEESTRSDHQRDCRSTAQKIATN
jgi:hypothetical protein